LVAALKLAYYFLFEAFFEFFSLDLRLPAISLQLIAVVALLGNLLGNA